MSEHKDIAENLEKAHEDDIINFRGIIYFGVGLVLLIVITFSLMWIFQYKFLALEFEKEDKKNANPMAKSKDKRTPKGIQLQSAPDFGVTDPKTGERVNLELREPQAEYRVLMKQWEDEWENGVKVIDNETNKETVVSLPIEDAKTKFLEGGNFKAKSGVEGEKALEEARSTISAASAGRVRSDIKR